MTSNFDLNSLPGWLVGVDSRAELRAWKERGRLRRRDRRLRGGEVAGFGFPLIQQTSDDRSELMRTVREVLVQTIEGLKYGAITLAPIVIALFALGTAAIIVPDMTVRVGAVVLVLALYVFRTRNPFATRSVTAEPSTDN